MPGSRTLARHVRARARRMVHRARASPIASTLGRLWHLGGIDLPVAVTLLARAWTIAGGLVTVLLIARCLSPELQGYYYTFNSLVAMQIFAELGLNTVLVQCVSHEMADMRIVDGRIVGERCAKSRLRALLKFGLAWSGGAALVFISILLPVGWSFFKMAAPRAPDIALPWTLLVMLTGAALLLNGVLAFLEGCGQIGQVASMRLVQAVGASIGVWAMLGARLQLLSFAGGLAAGCLIIVACLYVRYRRLIVDLLRPDGTAGAVHWRTEIWPLQWRIAVSWASGYLIFNLFNPLLFATQGAVAAGRFGMSLQILTAMNSAGMAWITTKVPQFCRLVARRERARLDVLFQRTLRQSLVFLATGSALAIVTVTLAQSHAPWLANRLVPATSFGVLCVVCLANHVVFAEAAYLRAHKQEPFMPVSVANGLTTALAALLLIPGFGLEGAVLAYAAGSVGVGLIGGTIVYARKKAEFSNS
ncbi:polysaccharide biosynthesis family protein [Burkholderia oklahomensis]|uniref:Polysaccharide biosynthesis family protein n=2 Tax=Burkholderia oklahomensis TaxID=342113 RepID=A0AAI8FPW2_9BURK|nr:polysaccharide biosynthesis family protein [Burkholderia oklahomensis]